MITHTPPSLKTEHAHLHEQLAKAALETGPLGDAAREVVHLLHPHFVKEEQYAMPPLGLLAALAAGGVTPEMATLLPLTRRLKAELPEMIREHKAIVAALAAFRDRAREAGRAEYEALVDALKLHAQTEEEVLYPAAVVVGELLELKLAERAPA